MISIFKRFKNEESGATAIEYGLIAALISVALIAGAQSLGTQLNTVFTDLSSSLQSAPAPAAR